MMRLRAKAKTIKIMELKIQKLPTYVTPEGFKDENTVYSISGVNFDYEGFTITIQWKVTPSIYQGVEGAPKQYKYQTVSAADISQEELGLLLAVSESLHAKCRAIPFIPTNEGTKSFDDLKAEVAGVGLPVLEKPEPEPAPEPAPEPVP